MVSCDHHKNNDVVSDTTKTRRWKMRCGSEIDYEEEERYERLLLVSCCFKVLRVGNTSSGCGSAMPTPPPNLWEPARVNAINTTDKGRGLRRTSPTNTCIVVYFVYMPLHSLPYTTQIDAYCCIYILLRGCLVSPVRRRRISTTAA